MFRYLPLLFMALGLSSCHMAVIQVAELQYAGTAMSPSDGTLIEDHLHLTYRLHNRRQHLSCTVYNATDQAITLDFTRSGIVAQGIYHGYPTDREASFEAIVMVDSFALAPRPTEIKGQSAIRIPRERLTLPPHAQTHFEGPLVPFNFTADLDEFPHVGYNELVPLAKPAPYQLRHFLVYYFENEPGQPLQINHTFDLRASFLVGPQRLRNIHPNPLNLYAADRQFDWLAMAAGWGITAVAGGLVYWVIQSN